MWFRSLAALDHRISGAYTWHDGAVDWVGLSTTDEDRASQRERETLQFSVTVTEAI